MLASCLDPEIRRWHRRPPADHAQAGDYVRQRAQDWERDERYTWAVCEPTTGEMIAEVELAAVDLTAGTAEAGCWELPAARGRGAATTALSAVLRFAFGGLDLRRVTFAWADGDEAAAEVAAGCGFRLEARKPAAWTVDGRQADVLVATRSATDR